MSVWGHGSRSHQLLRSQNPVRNTSASGHVVDGYLQWRAKRHMHRSKWRRL